MLRRLLTGFFWLVAASCALAQGVPGLAIPPGLFAGVIQLVGTFNPSDKASTATLSNGNLTLSASGTSSNARSTSTVMGPAYFEVTLGGANVYVGVSNSSAAIGTSAPGNDTNGVGYDAADGKIYTDGTGNVSGLGTSTTGDIIGVKAFADGSVAFNKNGGSFSSAFSSSTLTGGPLYIMCAAFSGGSLTLNLTPTYPVPAGFTFWGN